MSDRLKVAVMLVYSCREKRVGRMLEKRCMEAKICVIAWAALCDTLFQQICCPSRHLNNILLIL